MNITATIFSLLRHIKPTAIILTVRAIIVLALNRMPITWSYAHVAKKCDERIYPLTAYYDAASAISRERSFIRVMAASLHAAPYVIFRRICFAVSSCSSRYCLDSKTAARFCKAASKMSALNSTSHSTDARAFPNWYFWIFSFDLPNHEKATKGFARQINKVVCFHKIMIHGIVTNWNPGSGFGKYIYNGTTWILVKAL